MSARRSEVVLRHIRQLADAGEPVQESDRDLLDRYATARDETAFATLVRRHGPLVWNVCQRALPHHQDAEDAFQATFLVLARKAATVNWQTTVAPWLYAVARRLALKARSMSVHQLVMPPPEDTVLDPLEEVTVRDLLAVFDQEMMDLPEVYRGPLVLCYLEGRTQEEAADLLETSLSTLRRRLDRGRLLLRARLLRRGVTPALALGAAALAQTTGTAMPPGIIDRVLHPAGVGRAAELAAAFAGTASLKSRLGLALLVAGIIAAMVSVTARLPSREPSEPQANGPTPPRAQSPRGWPMYGGGLSRNPVALADPNLPDDWSVLPGKEKHVRWSVSLGTKAYWSVAVAGDKVFLGTNNGNPRNPAIKGDKGVMMCFRESDGEFLWQAIHDKLASGRVNDWPQEGIASTPCVEGDRLWYVSNRCELVCADTEGFHDRENDGVKDERYAGAQDADIVWRLDMMKQLNVFPHNLACSSPLVVGDLVFVVTGNGVDEGHINIPSPEAPSFLAVEKKTGKVRWSSNLPTRALVEARRRGEKNVDVRKLVDSGRLLMHGQWSSPVYAEPDGTPMVLFPGGDGWIYAFKPTDGELLWKFDCNPKKASYKLGPRGDRNDIVATPVVWENKLYIGVGQDPEHGKGVGHLWCIDLTRKPTNKDRDLSPVNDNFDPKDPVNKGSALVWHYGGMAPEKVDRDFLFGRTLSTCAVHDGLCYAADYGGWFHCLDARTGKCYWSHDMEADTWSSPVWAGEKVYIGNEAGEVLVFEHGKTKKLLRTVRTSRAGKVRDMPAVCNQTLFLVTDNPCKLYAIGR